MKINGWEKLNCMDVYVSGHPADIIGMITIDFFEWKSEGKYQGDIRSTLYDGIKTFKFTLTSYDDKVVQLNTFVDREPFQQFSLNVSDITLERIHYLLNSSFSQMHGRGKVRP
jgi:hypothetical protein